MASYNLLYIHRIYIVYIIYCIYIRIVRLIGIGIGLLLRHHTTGQYTQTQFQICGVALASVHTSWHQCIMLFVWYPTT